MKLQKDYLERVYAGVLGKIIGVYLGRPFEGWLYRDILQKLGPIEYYVHDRLNKPLIVADDDITGTFTFVRALQDYPEAGFDLSAEQIGKTWLNYIIENKTILWWGGLGMSTEHTAYQRLLDGIPAPRSGSIETNGRLVAEQIGAQIFIDAWAMVCPGDPDRAAELARRAGSVSHDGEAVHAARVIAAMEAQAFVETDLNKLLDVGVGFIPRDSIVFRLIDELRNFRARNDDWEAAMVDVLERSYGYDRYGGNCHIIPNHGVIIMALLYANDDFQRSLMIANTAGWDTDCNAGNVGCLMGIKNGLAAIDAKVDWRGPVADRVLLPTADGGSCISDAATLAVSIANMGHALAGEAPVAPKNGAKFHFSLPGSVQGFVAAAVDNTTAEATIAHDNGRLAIKFAGVGAARTARAATATFINSAPALGVYGVEATPTLYSTQRVVATLIAPPDNRQPVAARLFVSHHGASPVRLAGELHSIAPGASAVVEWTVPDSHGQPIFEIGVEVLAESGAGTLLLDRLTWSGTPAITLSRLKDAGVMFTRAWVNGVSHSHPWDPYEHFRIVQDRGRGLLMHGTRDWTDYTVTATVEPVLATASGLAARVQGMRRYYAVLLATNAAGARVLRLVKVIDTEHVLAEAPFEWKVGEGDRYPLSLSVKSVEIRAAVEGGPTLQATDPSPIAGGGIALVVEDGRLQSGVVRVEPILH